MPSSGQNGLRRFVSVTERSPNWSVALSTSRGISTDAGLFVRAVFRVITCNLNGVRAAARKGFFRWVDAQAPDVICLQELKAHEHQLPPEALGLTSTPHRAITYAQKKGYSGVAVFSKQPPERI